MAAVYFSVQLNFVVILFTIAGVYGDIFRNQDSNACYEGGAKLIEDNLKVKKNTNTAKSGILFVGDGLGITTITAARIYDGQLKSDVQFGEENVLSWETFPWTALSKTYHVDLQGTDSASAATALLCGIKTNSGVLGVDATAEKGNCASMTDKSKVVSILALAERAGMSTGIVTTTRITHATPASAYAHSVDRDWENDVDVKSAENGLDCPDIALQLIDFPYGNGMEVVFAGGRRELTHKNQTDPEYPDKKGHRGDGRNLIQEWLDKRPNSHYVWNKTAFDEIDVNKVDRVIGLFESSHMQYELNRHNDKAGEPSIAEMVEKAIKILQKNPKGYFLLVEAGRIDHGHHGGSAIRALTDAVAMNKAVAKAIDIVKKDETLVTVTADHSHVFTIGGYPKRGNPVLGLEIQIGDTLAVDVFNKTYTTLGYADGPGGLNGSRPDLRTVNTTDEDFLQQATVLLDSESHGSEDVGVFADGPGAYLFHGVVDQEYVFHVMDFALCLSESKQKLCVKHVDRGGPNPKSMAGPSSLATPSLYVLLVAVLRLLI